MGAVGVGIPEVMILAMVLVWGIVPLAAGVWALVTLHRLRLTQDAIRATLERIEQAVSRR